MSFGQKNCKLNPTIIPTGCHLSGLSREQLLESNPTVIASQCHRP